MDICYSFRKTKKTDCNETWNLGAVAGMVAGDLS